MNATQLSLAGSLTDAVTGDRAADTRPLSAFRHLLDEIWRLNEVRLAKLAIGLGLTGERASDVLQDVYVMALERPPAIDNEAELLRWLFRVTVNRCQLEHRRKGRWRRLWSSLAQAWDGAWRPETGTNYGELKREVERALATLAEDDRALVAMRYFSDLNSRKIAEIVGIPEATVRGRLRAARRNLAEELADWES